MNILSMSDATVHSQPLAGRTAVIMGATSGIGEAIAATFGAAGANVVISGRREALGARIAAPLGARGLFVPADVSSEVEIEAVVTRAAEVFGRVDCMVNNAGGPVTGRPVTEIDLDAFDDALRVHLRGVLAGTKHAARAMREQHSGSIVNTASINGTRAGMTGLAYSTAKAAVLHLTRCAAVELGEFGIRVNSVSPGPVATGIFAKSLGIDHCAADAEIDRVRAVLTDVTLAWQPLRVSAAAANVANAALFLASDASAMITGHDLVVDGGILAGRPASVMRDEQRRLARGLGA
jgi:NAD(P)-dependent dehydrogenase (short-subunit alcohol dehydrogenase family)